VEILNGVVEPSVAGAEPGTRFQFEREGYFIADAVDSKPDALVFNRIVTLRDTWAKITGGGNGRHAAPSPADDTPSGSPSDAAPEAPASRTEAEIRAAALARAPELADRFTRYTDVYGISAEDADLLASDLGMARYFEEALAAHDSPRAVAAWILNELLRELKDTPLEELPFGGADLGRLVALIEDDTLSGRLAKEVLAAMIEGEGTPEEIVADRGLRQDSNGDALVPGVDRVLAANDDKVAQYRAGKTGLIGFFVGQVMRETAGKANPQLVRDLVAERLG
jgi:glutaminyl-tRNA synthetase